AMHRPTSHDVSACAQSRPVSTVSGASASATSSGLWAAPQASAAMGMARIERGLIDPRTLPQVAARVTPPRGGLFAGLRSARRVLLREGRYGWRGRSREAPGRGERSEPPGATSARVVHWLWRWRAGR